MPQPPVSLSHPLPPEALAAAFDASADALLVLDEKTIIAANAAAGTLFGIAATELAGKPVATLSPVLQPDGSASAWAAEAHRTTALRDGGVRFEWVHRRVGAGTFPAHVTLTPFTAGAQTLYWSVVRDVSESAAREAALRASEERYRLAFEGARDALWDWDISANKVHFSARWMEMLGFADGELPNELSTWSERVHPDDRAAVNQALQEHLAGGTPHYAIEYRLQGKDGEYRTIVDRGQAIRDDRGRAVRLVGIQTEGRGRAGGASEDKDGFFSVASDLLCLMDTHGTIARVNPAWERTVGYRTEELASKPFFKLLHKDDVATAHAEWKGLLDSGRTAAFENRVRCRDGSYRWVMWDAILDSAHDRAYAIGRDITVRKRTEIELRRTRDAAEAANRAKSEFLANMSHEIRTPLNAVLGIASLMRESALGDEQRELVETMLRSGQGLLEIVNQVLDFSKAEAGKLELSAAPVEVASLVEETCEALAELAERRGLAFAVHVDREVPRTIQGDGGRIRQVLTNLVGNAIKFTESGEVTVHARAERDATGGGRLHLEVRDTGIGIPENEHARVFEAFNQVEGHYSRRYDGTGLGLAITRRLVELMGGTIGLESALGSGSRFWVDVPFSESTAPAREDVLAEFAGRRAIVLDHHAATRAAVCDLLSRWGFAADQADQPDTVNALLRAGRTDPRPPLLVVDRSLPGADALVAGWRTSGAAAVVELRTRTGSGATVVSPSSLTRPVRAVMLRSAVEAAVAPPAQGAAAPEPKAPAAPAPSASLRLLLVEDNPVNQLVATKMLKKLGCQADIAGNGREALEALSRGAYDLVLMDCQMPEMDGFEATRSIRAGEPEGRRQPIIAMTALAMSGDRERCLAAGMDDYLSKPVKIEALRETLQRWSPASP